MKLSVGRRIITPLKEHEPFHLSGHAIRVDAAEGVLDDIVTTVYVFRQNSQTMAWVSCELIGLSRDDSTTIINRISKQFNVEPKNIIVGFTHSHSAPVNEVKGAFKTSDDDTPRKYMDWVIDQVLEATHDAFESDGQTVSAQTRKTTIQGYYGNRNSLENVGDKDFIELRFVNSDNHVVASVANFNCHPTVLGPQNLHMSGDLAGFVRRHIEKRDSDMCMIMLGASGNMSNRLYREGNDEAELIRTGNGIMNQVDSNPHWIEVKSDTLTVETFEFSKHVTLSLETKKQQLNDVEKRINTAKTFDEKKVYTSAKAFLEREIAAFSEHYDLDLDCRYIELGDVGIFTVPAELFSQFGQDIKKAINKKCSVLWGYTFYNGGYLYNEEETGQSFESIVSNIPSGTTEAFVDDVVSFLSE